MFLNINSYNDFLDEEALVLLGRTGTGKTAILNCLSENVNKGRVPMYSSAVIVPFDLILRNILETGDDISNPDISYHLMDSISLYINCYVMKMILEREGYEKYPAMKSYICNNGLKDLGDLTMVDTGISKIRSMVQAANKYETKISSVTNNVAMVLDIITAFRSNGYDEAFEEMKKALANKKILVLIDTVNEYNMQNAKLILSVKALIETCFKYYNTLTEWHIMVKISIPSEIYTYILETLPGKQQGNAVIIQWKNNDLIRMIALRLLYLSLHQIYLTENMNYFIENPDRIKDMIHSTQVDMINDVISMYTASYSNIMDAIESVLSNRRYYILGSELDNALKSSFSQVIGYGTDEIKRVLIESGLIGKITKCTFSYVGDGTEGKHKISVDTHIRFVNAKFEYQIKGRIRFNKDDYYVLHPMCYEHFECEVGLQTLVYPDDYDIDEEVRKNVKLKD